MKKMLLAVLLLTLTLSSALAEGTLVDAYAASPAEAAMSEYLARRLSDILGEAFAVRHEADAAQAVNAFLALPAESSLLLSSQEAMILSLQGYTDQDLRQALLPVTCVAASDCFLYASPATAELLEQKSVDALAAYTEAHPYDVCLARLVDAGPHDYLSLEATQEMYVDQSLYMDYMEAAQAAEDGAVDVLALSGAMLPQEAAAYTLLGPAGLPGLWQGVFVQHAGGDALRDRVASALPAVCAEEGWQTLLAAGGYASAPCPTQDAFTQEVQTLVSDYVRYLTNEGLFFYEQ